MLLSLDLFSGYGGISYGLKEYLLPVAYCEIEPYAQAVITTRITEGDLPFAPIFADVKNIKGEINACDIITAGFPCQDISSAGLGAGLEGERSGLFYQVVRLTKEIAPAFVFLENVPAIRTRGLRQVVGAFTEMGYDCRWTCLSAASVGAPHKRERWFLLAHTPSKGLEGYKRAKPRYTKPTKHLREEWEKVEPTVCRSNYVASVRMDQIKSLGNGVVPIQVKAAFEKLIGF